MISRTPAIGGWWLRAIGNRLAPLVNPRLVATLSVRGRRSGQWRTVPAPASNCWRPVAPQVAVSLIMPGR
jgi:hypothetical protein